MRRRRYRIERSSNSPDADLGFVLVETRLLPTLTRRYPRRFTLITRTAPCLRQPPSCVAVYPRDETCSLPTSLAATHRGFAFYASHEVASAKAGRCSHQLHSAFSQTTRL